MSTVDGGGKIVTNGLILHLDAANTKSYSGTGVNLVDLTINRNDGTLANGASFVTTYNGGILLDGTNDHILLPNGLLSGTGDFTVNQFIQSDSSLSGGTTFGNYLAGNLQILFGQRYIGMWLNNSSTYLGTSPWNVTLSQFTTNPIMITALRTGGSTTALYLNGTLQKNGSSTSTIGTSSNQFRIGSNTNTSELFKGNVFITQVYNRALSSEEIIQNYNAHKGRFGL